MHVLRSCLGIAALLSGLLVGGASRVTASQPAPVSGWEYAVLYVDHLNRTYALDFGGERRLFHDYNTFFEAVARSRMVDGGDKPSERTPEQMSHVLRDAGWRVVSWSPASQGTAEVSFVRRAAVPRTKNAPAPHPWRIIPDDTVEARPSI